MLKLESDFHSPTLVQHIAARYLAGDGYDAHLEHEHARSTASGATRCWPRSSATCPARSTRPVPHGGHHVWATLERPVDERTLYAEAIRHGVSFMPGGAVTAERRGADVDAAVVLAARSRRRSRRASGGWRAPCARCAAAHRGPSAR